MSESNIGNLGLPTDYSALRGGGKTPPPAPSASYNRINSLIEHETGLKSTYRPPALRALHERDPSLGHNLSLSLGGSREGSIVGDDGSEEILVGIASGVVGDGDMGIGSGVGGFGNGAGNGIAGYRRARAGTMPSELLNTGPARYVPPAARHSGSSSVSRSGASTPSDNFAFEQGGYFPSGGLGVARPTLRHTASSAAAMMSSHSASESLDSTANRLRSGSLTENAFGTGFSNTWLANPGLQNGLKTTLSNGSGSGSAGADEYPGLSTMDYLGLADKDLETPRATNFSFQPAPSVINPRAPTIGLTASGGAASMSPSARNRANTLANFTRPAYKPSASYQDLIAAANLSLGGGQGGTAGLYSESDIQSIGDAAVKEYLAGYAQGLVPSGGGGTGLSGPNMLASLASARPRATTINMLDPAQRNTARGGLGYSDAKYADESSNYPSALLPSRGVSSTGSQDFGSAPIGSRANSARHAVNPSISSTVSHVSVTGSESGAAGQMPTRSLWLGNLDVMTTAQELMGAFAQYGPIESLRLLPEKSCAFVNFVDRADAVRAKDEILNRFGGHLPGISDTPVRVGFGKIDSVPTAAPSASTLKYSLSNSSLSSLASSDAGDDRPRRSAHPMDSSSQPTRALWVGSIPSSTTPGTLLSIFGPFGAVESARVLSNKQCGFVNFETVEAAVAARTALNGREILGSEVGAIKIGFAKVPVRGSASSVSGNFELVRPTSAASQHQNIDNVLPTLKQMRGTSAVTVENVANIENYGSNLVIDLINKGMYDDVLIAKGASNADDLSDVGSSVSQRLPNIAATDLAVSEEQMIMMVLTQGDGQMEDVVAAGSQHKPSLYYSYIPVLAERQQSRTFDVAELKEIRKRLDAGFGGQEEADEIAVELMEECVALASDYIGNTVIQKLYEKASIHLRIAMLDRIAPHLAIIGTHKNGTWAAQKIIECSRIEEEMALIARNLAPYVPPLAADSFGNYLISACLRFGAPYNTFIFDAMVDRIWDIAQTRFGARCMRTCLESPHTSQYQRKRIATAIILHSIPLATNPNGALLLTWLMDTSGFPGRYGLLASRLASYVQHLCTHKLASLTVLRIVSQKLEPDAVTTMLNAIFASPDDRALIEVLADQVHGTHTLSKILCGAGMIDEDRKPALIDATRRVLVNMKMTSSFAYRRLLEECGLPAPMKNGGGPGPGQGGAQRGFGGNGSPNPNGHGQFRSGPHIGGGNAYGQNNNGYRNQNGPPYLQQQHGMGYNPGMPQNVQDMAMHQMVSSMQAFQLAQGMAGLGVPGLSGQGQQGAPGLSPLLIPNSIGQALQPGSPVPHMSPTPTLGSFATPHAGMMSPNSDPFNPFAPSANQNRTQHPGSTPLRFQSPNRDESPAWELSPSFGGLGMQSQPLHSQQVAGMSPQGYPHNGPGGYGRGSYQPQTPQ